MGNFIKKLKKKFGPGELDRIHAIRGKANIHTHHFIGRCIPDKISSDQISRHNPLKDLIALEERTLYCLRTFPILSTIANLFTGGSVFRAAWLLGRKEIYHARNAHLKDMKKSDIDYSVVLLVDYSYAASTDTDTGGFYDYKSKILPDTSKWCAEDPFRFFVFHCFEPRYMVREDLNRPPGQLTSAQQLLVETYDNYGIAGVKIYPALGFHPIPDQNLKPRDGGEPYRVNIRGEELSPEERELVKENLEFMYGFCQDNQLPILTHCGPGGAFVDLGHEREIENTIWEFSHPRNYEKIVQDYEVKICLGHMGGKTLLPRERRIATDWRAEILRQIDNNDNYRGKIYTDQSYEISGYAPTLKKGMSSDAQTLYDETKQNLLDLKRHQYILFGTDWPLGILSFFEWCYTYLYYYQFRNDLDALKRYFRDNAARFLFGETGKISDNHIQYLKRQNNLGDGDHFDLTEKPWIERRGDEYFIAG